MAFALAAIPAVCAAQQSPTPDFDALGFEAAGAARGVPPGPHRQSAGQRDRGREVAPAGAGPGGDRGGDLRVLAGTGQPLRPASGRRLQAADRPAQPHRRGAGDRLGLAGEPLVGGDADGRRVGARRARHEGHRDRRADDDDRPQAAGRAALPGRHPRRQRRRGDQFLGCRVVRAGEEGAAPGRRVPAERGRAQPAGTGGPDRVLRRRGHGEGALLGQDHGAGHAGARVHSPARTTRPRGSLARSAGSRRTRRRSS